MPLTILLFIVSLSVLIIAHELGHFMAARRAGMKVEEFGIGFPPRVWGKKKGGVLYSINLLPIGGFVRILGEDGGHRDEKGSFSSSPILSRMLVIAAGVGMNVVVAWALLSTIFMIGAPTELTSEEMAASARDRAVFISFVAQDSPASSVGLQANDKIVSLSDEASFIEPIEASAVQEFVSARLGTEISIAVARGSQVEEYSVVPRQNTPEGEGALGIALAEVGTVSYAPHIALWRAGVTSVTRLGDIARELTNVVVTLVRTGSASESVSGPVGVASMAGTIQQQGVVNYLYFLAIISLNLAVINAIPFPALDGGRFLFLIIEAIKGSPVNKRYEAGIHAVGFAFLMLLVVLITIRDIRNLM